MNKIEKILSVGVLIALVIAIGGYFFPQVTGTLNSTFGTRFPDGISIGKGAPLPTTQGATIIGATGSQISNLVMGTCYIRNYAATVAATSSALVDCQGTLSGTVTALAGVKTGDYVQAVLSTTTAATALSIIGATASSTNGYIQLEVFNSSSTAYTWPTSATTTLTATGTVSFISSR